LSHNKNNIKIDLMKKVIIGILFILVSQTNIFAQCCAQGAPMSGDANVGVLKKGGLRIGAFYKYSESKNLNKEINKAPQVAANFNFIGYTLAYGITHKLTAEFESGYFLNKTQDLEFVTPESVDKVSFNGFGFTNAVVFLKHVLLKSDSSNFELSGGLGFKFPFEEQLQAVDGVTLPVDNLPSTYAPGIAAKFLIFKKSEKLKMAFVLMERIDYNFENYKRYKFGTSAITTFIASKNLDFISDKVTGLIQIRDEYRVMDRQTDFSTGEKSLAITSGNHLVIVAPQLAVRLFKKLNTSVAADIPVYRHYNADRLQNIYAVMFNCTVDL
jgi:hypothetical protein